MRTGADDRRSTTCRAASVDEDRRRRVHSHWPRRRRVASIVERAASADARHARRRMWNDDVSRRRRLRHSAACATCCRTASFPFPKSLYAVEDALRFFVASKPDAIVVDFFAGSGTTAHAVMRLNKQDGGRRRSISVTNNEVSADEQKALRAEGSAARRPRVGAVGICDYITKPRIEAAITGKTPDGEPIKGDYKFTDEFPMADGFEENVEFFTLTYEAPLRVASHREFARIAPLLWLRAGSRGRRIDDVSSRLGCRRRLRRARRPRPGRRRSSRRSTTAEDVDARVHRHRRGPAVRVGRARAARPRRAGAALRVVPAQLRDRGRQGRAVKFTLKDYQEDARRRRARAASSRRRTIYERDGDVTSFSLTATTGAGKTVMAAAVIEALFYGNDDVRLRSRPRRGGDLVLRRPEPQRADALPADGGVRQAHVDRPRHHRAAVREAAARARARCTSSTPRSSSKNSLLTRGHVDDRRRRTSLDRTLAAPARPAGVDDLGDDREHDRGRRPHAST